MKTKLMQKVKLLSRKSKYIKLIKDLTTFNFN